MSCKCDLTGKTKEETLKNQLKWMAGWALNLLRVARTQHYVLTQIHNMHSIRHEADRIDPLTTMDAIGVMAAGGADAGEKMFELGSYRNDEGCIHQNLELNFKKMEDEGNDKIEIPVKEEKNEPVEVASRSEVSDEDIQRFRTACGQLIASKEIINDLVQKYYTGSFDGLCDQKITLKMNVDVTDQNDRNVSLSDLDVDGYLLKLK